MEVKLNVISWKHFLGTFKFICVTAAIAMLAYCTYDFLQNHDLSEVSFVVFNQDEDSKYPQTTLCLTAPFLQDELKKIGDGVNSTSYLQFLSGEIWDDKMKDVDIENVTQSLEDHVLESCVKSKFGGNCDDKGHISTIMYPYRGTKCLSFHYTYPEVRVASMWIKSSIFANGIRPHRFTDNAGFALNVGFIQQDLRRPSAILQWPPRSNSSATYAMRFDVDRIEVIRRRQKRGHECRDWKKFDSLVQEEILSGVGCRPFNSASMMKFPMCSTKDQMKQIHEKYSLITSVHTVPPCSEIQSLQIKQEAEENTNFVMEKQMYRDLKTDLGTIDGWFRVSVMFGTNTFKQIKQIRAYNMQSLIGNAGGYVGLFVGYTVAELPILLGMIYEWITRALSAGNNSNGNKLFPVAEVNVNEQKTVYSQELRNTSEKYLELEAKLQVMEHENQKLRIKWDTLEHNLKQYVETKLQMLTK